MRVTNRVFRVRSGPLRRSPIGVGTGRGLAFDTPWAGDGFSGHLYGTVMVVDPGGLDDGNQGGERLARVHFDFDGGGTLVVVGAHGADIAELKSGADQPQVRAVIGGTGMFIGARGQLVASMAPNGNWEYEFVLTRSEQGAGETVATREFTIMQEPPDLLSIGEGVGRGIAFSAPLAGDELVGTLHGWLVTITLDQQAAGRENEQRIGLINYDFGDGTALVVAGMHGLNLGDPQLVEGRSSVRAVIGGTGRFLGATGQVVTTRQPDGRYEHRFELVD